MLFRSRNNYKFSFYDEYTTTVILNILDKTDSIVYTAEIEEVYPKEIGEISMGYDKDNEYMTQDVIFVFRKYTPKMISMSYCDGLPSFYSDISLLTDLLGGGVDDLSASPGNIGRLADMRRHSVDSILMLYDLSFAHCVVPFSLLFAFCNKLVLSFNLSVKVLWASGKD